MSSEEIFSEICSEPSQAAAAEEGNVPAIFKKVVKIMSKQCREKRF